jgi:GT2 family glycosyltransferase/peptidoglycan/xylan/chitin deacetylase (PgdA/CDA1 family)
MFSSIIIPTRQRPVLLARVLDSLSCQSEGDFEVIVVCDGEDPGTRLLAGSHAAPFPLSWIFLPENRGSAAARNAGAAAARGDILLFLDDDTVAAPDWVSRHRGHHLASEERELVVCGRIHELYPRPPASRTEHFFRAGRERELVALESNPGNGDVASGRHACCGLNCSLRRTMFLEAGGFDARLRFVHEDLELGYRLHDHGVRFVFEPRAVVHHHNSKDLESYHRSAWSSGGRVDLYRACDKGQRNPQTQGLARLHHPNAVRRWKARLAWERPDELRQVARLMHEAAEATGWGALFRLWSGLAFSLEYWDAVRSEGVTADSLRQLVGVPLPVLAFHSVAVPATPRERGYYVSPRRFSRFMLWLSRRRYRCLDPNQSLNAPTPERPVLLTFDDGYDDFYLEVFPNVDRFGLKPIVFLVVDHIGGSNAWDERRGFRSRRLLTVDQIREMHRHGIRFGSHTLTHPWLPGLSSSDLIREVMDSKSRLEDLVGSEVTCFAYPYGGVDRRVRAAVARAGYRVAFTTCGGLNFWGDALSLNRVEVNEQDTLADFALKLRVGRDLKQDVLNPLRQILPEPLRGSVRAWTSTLLRGDRDHPAAS